jgi:hypothetical protein
VLPAPSCSLRMPVTVCLVPFFLKVCFRAGLKLAAGVVSVVLQFCIHQSGHVLLLKSRVVLLLLF